MRMPPAGTGLVAVAVTALVLATVPPGGRADEPSPFGGPALFDGQMQRLLEPASPSTPPPDHTASFATSHALAVSANSSTCASCHTETWCADCHGGLAAPVAVHDRAWLATHAHEALADPTPCASCHTPGRFCAGCHLAADVMPDVDARPQAGFAVHPQGWLDPGAASNHATEARVDLVGCVSCHTGSDCESCHIAINPHGSDFGARCLPMLDAAPQTCASCHDGRATLPLEALRTHPGCAR